MAFSYTKDTGDQVLGRLKMTTGTYTNGSGDTGGNIDTGLTMCEMLLLQPKGDSAIATANAVNESFPIAGSAVTVVTADDEDGYWIAFGY